MNDIDKAFDQFARTKQGDEMICLLAEKMSIGHGLAYQIAKSWFEEGFEARVKIEVAA